MSEEPTTNDAGETPVKPGLAVRLFLIVLPVGLAFMVPISLWIYYQKKNAPPPAASQYAAILRRDLNAADFARYRRILEQDIGDRSTAQPEHLAAAEAFIESTLGYDNMGYAVRRLPFEANGRTLSNFVAELPGTERPHEVILVLAFYDDADASGIAGMLCAAHALTGDPLERTVRFAAVQNGGLNPLAADRLFSASAVEVILAVCMEPVEEPASWSGAELRPFTFQRDVDENARLQELQALVQAIRAAGAVTGSPVKAGVCGTEPAHEALHHMQGEEGRLMHHELEARLVDRHQHAVGLCDGGGDARAFFDERHLAEEAVGLNDLDGDAVNPQLDFPLTDNEHFLGIVSAGKNDVTRGALQWSGF